MVIDFDVEVCCMLLCEVGVCLMIYGYMYWFGEYDFGGGLKCVVLLDWDFDGMLLCGDVICLLVVGL